VAVADQYAFFEKNEDATNFQILRQLVIIEEELAVGD